ncbi:hypothetical protein ACSHT2_06825 [Bradyrhizobium sp. PUT101]|uniref:hypothetical protein n=1 Tax=Bradyrhizobium sp. PUT101 TaxID=3447427 RepID=UPI003F8503D0
MVSPRLLADGWMHFETESPCAEGGHGLSVARVHDSTGTMIATAIQETLMVHLAES